MFVLIREELQRFPTEHTVYSKLIKGLSSWEEGQLDTLETGSADDSHRYRVQILFTKWTMQRDWGLKGWLLRRRNDIRPEKSKNGSYSMNGIC